MFIAEVKQQWCSLNALPLLCAVQLNHTKVWNHIMSCYLVSEDPQNSLSRNVIKWCHIIIPLSYYTIQMHHHVLSERIPVLISQFELDFFKPHWGYNFTLKCRLLLFRIKTSHLFWALCGGLLLPVTLAHLQETELLKTERKWL